MSRYSRLAVALASGAGLLIKSLVALQNVALGFRPENALVMRADGARLASGGHAARGNSSEACSLRLPSCPACWRLGQSHPLAGLAKSSQNFLEAVMKKTLNGF